MLAADGIIIAYVAHVVPEDGAVCADFHMLLEQSWLLRVLQVGSQGYLYTLLLNVFRL